jgi:hypothetical protein
MNVIEGFGHEGTDGAFVFILSEEGDNGIADVGGHVFDPGSKVGVGGVVIYIEDLANEVGTEFC